jgi:glycosyltransferase involved in cell wall biosynthesis
MFVRNACTNDVRVLREAATLQRAGWEATIVALQLGGTKAPPDEEVRDGVRIVRVGYPADWRERWHLLRSYPQWGVKRLPGAFIRSLSEGPASARRTGLRLALAIVALPYIAGRTAWFVSGHRARKRTPAEDDGWDYLAWWRLSLMPWAAAAVTAAPVADVYHGHDLTALPAAVLAARRRRRGSVVYDSHELFIESGLRARQPWWIRWILGRLEQSLLRKAAGVITVNESIARELHRRYGGPYPIVVRNAPPRHPIDAPRPDHLRTAAGIPPEAPVVLYHGGFQRDRGLDVLAEAMTDERLRDAHLVFLGFGPLTRVLEALAAQERFGGRLHVLPGVPADDLLDWVASADVSAMPNQPHTLNERYSTPNKLFESLAVGTPVVSSDFPERRAIVIDDPAGPLGAVCDPTRPGSVAGALAEVLSLPPDAMTDLRRRCQQAAHERYNWELESARLLDLYERIHRGSASS